MASTSEPTTEFLSLEAEAHAFWHMRRRLLRTLVRQTFAESRFRVTLVLVLSGLLWASLFWLFADGFSFLSYTMPHTEIYDELVNGIFGMFFATLLMMLVLSSAIILYSGLFRSPEVAFLLTAPVRAERIFLHKFQEALLLSSWGFLLLGSPMLLAYGVVEQAPWYFYVLLPLFIGGFVYIPVALGGIACLLIVDRLPHSRGRLVLVAVGLLLGGALWLMWLVLGNTRSEVLTPAWFQEMLGRLRLTEGRLLPSWWLSAGILDAAAEVWDDSILFLALMIANALFLRQAALWLAGRRLRRAYDALYRRSPARRRVQAAWIDRTLARLLAGVSVPIRLLLIKDFRTFRRDPMQWTQFLIFFGLLALYFTNIPRFTYRQQYVGWVNLVSFLNVAVVGLLMSTFTTRFVFPLISLECRRFWLLGLLPLGRQTILWSKFFFATGGSILPCAGLILLSDLMLHVPAMIVLSHQLTCLLLCTGLAGIAVGMGARLPNLREQSPSRIAAGFGGTLTLVLSALYIVTVVLLTALPCHFYLAGDVDAVAWLPAQISDLQWWLRFWLVAGAVASVLLGAAATIVPMWIGFRAFQRIEF